MYCIYLDKEIDESEKTRQHIIPLSLGGVNEFSINIDKNVNSDIGSKIEGKLINEFTMKLRQIHKDVKGHSNKTPKIRTKGTFNGNPASIAWEKEKIDIFDHIKNTHSLDGKFSMSTKIDIFTRVQFAAKIALETGYYLFNETFVKYADCNTLRNIVFSKNIREDMEKGKFKDIRFIDNLHQIEEKDKEQTNLIKYIFKGLDSSTVILIFSPSSIIFQIAIFGEYLASINVKANIDRFPIWNEEYRLGYVLACQDNKLCRGSFYNLVEQLHKDMQNIETN